MRVVVLGAGRMGQRHLQNAIALGLDVMAVSDPVPGRAAQALAGTGLDPTNAHVSPTSALATSPEVVVVASTADSHADLTVAAAAAGARFILCEKPLATSLDDADRMIEACEQAGAVLATNHQMRFMEQYRTVKSTIDSPEFGGLASISVTAGNFGLAMNGTHYVELFRYMTGSAATWVTGWFSTSTMENPRGAQFEDRAGSMRIEGPTGQRLHLDAGDDQGHGVVVVYAGRNGHVVSDELRGSITVTMREAEHRAEPTTRYGMSCVVEHLTVAPADALVPSRDVLSALITGEDVPSGEDGRNAMRALVAAYVSNENGHVRVAIDDDLPGDRRFPWA